MAWLSTLRRISPTARRTRSTTETTLRRRPRRAIGAVASIGLLATVLALVASTSEPAAAANPWPVMTGYIPLNVEPFYDGLKEITRQQDSGLGTGITYTVGITNAGAGAIITYDHWEDGFEADPTTPAQSSTLVFGDGNPANGNAATYCGTACTGDLLPPGASLIMPNLVPRNRTAGARYFDGGDKVLSTRGFTITAGGYPSTLGSLAAGVVSSYDTTLYRTEYTVPVGPDSPTKNNQTPFNYTAVLVQAAAANTLVEVDTDADGTFENTATIGEGETRLVKVTKAGARVRASKPVQVHLGTGDTTANYESRWLTLFADVDLASDYLSPAGGPSTSPTSNFLFNPGTAPITVTSSIAGSTPVTIAARSSVFIDSPVGTAVRFKSTGGEPFAAVAAIGALHNSNSSTWDWGATLVPYSRLTTQVVLGWAPGNSAVPPSGATNANKHAFNPVWVTPAADTTVYVDYDGNPTTGAVEAAAGHCMGARYDQAIPATALASLRISNSATSTMTGARVYTCDGTRLAAAWGQDPAVSTTGSPGFDAGYTVIPTTTLIVEKTSVNSGDVNSDGKVNPGDTVTYEIAVSNAGNVPFNELAVQDVLKPGVTYVAGSMVVDDGDTQTPIADDVAPRTPFPLDEGGAVIPQITAGQRVVVRFDVVVDKPFTSSNRYLDNEVCVSGVEAGPVENPILGCNVDRITMPLADLEVTKVQTNTPANVGQNVTYRVRVENKGPDAAPDVVVNDLLPAGLEFVSVIPAVGTYNANTGAWSVGTLANGATRDLTITAKVLTTSVTNYAQVTNSGAVDPDSTPGSTSLGPNNPPSQDDEASVTTTVAPAADLSLTKTITAGPNATGEVTYGITVTNSGPSPATNVVVQERPANSTAVTYTPPTGTTVTGDRWTIPALAVGASTTLTVKVTHSTFPTTNTAEITSAGQHDPDSTPGNNRPTEDDQATVTVTRSEADLRLSKTASANPALGGNVTYTLTVTNDGPDAATGVVVRDKLPAGLTYVSHTGGTYDPVTGNWSVGALANGANTSLQIVARVDILGAIVNRAEVTASDQHDPDSTPGNGTPPGGPEDDESSVSITATGGRIGDTVWTDRDGDGVQDAGEAGIPGATVTLYSVVGDERTVIAATTTDTMGNYSFPNLAPGSYAVVVTPPSGLAATTPTTKSVTLTPGQVYLDGDFGFRPEADLSLTKTVLSQPSYVGDQVTYRITVSNAGPSAATNVRARDPLPSGLTLVSSTPSQGTYTASSGVWEIGTIASGASVTLDITATVTTTASIINVAEITASDQHDPDSTPGNDDSDEDDQDEAQVKVDALIDLSLAKTLTTTPTHVGDPATYTVTVRNAGPSIATGVTVADKLPAGLTFVSSSGDGAYDAATGVWTVGSIAVNGSATLTIRATATGAGAITNTAQVATANEDDKDSTPGNDDPDEDDQDSVTTTVRPLADLSLAKTTVTTPTHLGGQVVYEIVVRNAGPSTATGVVVTDKLPTGLTHVSHTVSAGNGAYVPATGVWSVGSIASGSSATLRITATVNALSVTNTAQVTSSDQDDPDSTPGNDDPDEDDQDSVTTTVRPLADLSLTKTAVTTPTHLGGQVVYEIVVRNAGPSTATGVVVTDKLPTGLTHVSHTVSAGNGAYVPATGVWSVGSIASGSSATLRITATVNALSVTNTAQVTSSDQDDPDSTPGNDDPDEDDQDSVTTTVAPRIDLSLAKAVTDTPTHVGDTATYRLNVANAGPSAATGVTVSDPLPTGLTFVGATGDGAYDATTGVWTIGTVASGGTASIVIVTKVTAAGAIDNVAQVATANEDDVDSTPGNDDPDEDDQDNAAIEIRELADLSLTKTVDEAPAHVGDTVTFVIAVTNAGPSVATGVTVSDQLPTGLVYLDDDSEGAYDPATGIWTVGTIAVGATATLRLDARIDQPVTTNTAEIASSDQDDPDSTPGNGDPTEDDRDLVTVTVDPLIDLTLAKTVATPATYLGDQATFAVTVANQGPSPATGVVVSDKLPAGLEYVSDDADGDYDPATGDWTVGNLPVDGSRTLRITVTVNALQATNFAEVTDANEEDATSTPAENPLGPDDAPDEDDEDAADITVAPLVDLSLTKTSTPATVNQLDDATFVLRVHNDGPSPATGVVVEDQLPDGVTFVSSTASHGAYDATTGLWTIGNLAIDATAELTIKVHVDNAGTITNRAQVVAVDQHDRDSTPGNVNEPGHVPEDDEDASTLSSAPMVDLSVEKQVSATAVHVGSNVTYTVTVGNDGPSPATGVVVTDKLPAGLTFVSADPSSGTYDSATGLWTVGDLGIDGNATLKVIAKVTAPGAITNRAEVTDADQDDVDSTPGNGGQPGHVAEDDEDSVTIEGVQIDLAVTNAVDRDTVNVGETITYSVTITNEGHSTATGVVVDGALPPGLEYQTSTGGTYDPTTGRWDIGTLPPGESVTLSIVAKVTVGGPITATAQVHSAVEPDVDSTPGNSDPDEDDQDSVLITGLLADLSMEKVVDQEAPIMGRTITYGLRVRNGGPSTATGVTVRDQLPVGLTYVSDDGAGAYDPATGIWTVPTGIPADGEVRLNITVRVDTAARTVNRAEVLTSDQPDPDSTPGNNVPDEDDEDTAAITPISASLQGSVWIDRNGDGKHDPSEPAIPGVTVNLYDVDGNLVASTVTGPDGSYRFEGLPPGRYAVEIDKKTLPDTVAGQTIDPDDVLDGRHEVTLEPGDNLADVDFGYAPVPDEPGTPVDGTTPPTTPATPGQPTTPTTRPQPLARTGLSVSGPVGLGLLLLVTGAAAVMFARRRRPA